MLSFLFGILILYLKENSILNILTWFNFTNFKALTLFLYLIINITEQAR